MPLDDATHRYTLPGATGEWEIVIGLEVHAQVLSSAKLFSGASTEFGAAPNTHVSLVDAAMPGMLPVINQRCVEQAVKTGLGLNAKINLFSRFDRKNYFYPDLAKNYQISQYDLPLCYSGYMDVESDGHVRRVGITRAHMEEDTARNTHTIGNGESGVDFNRSGVPLLEIVTEPDIRSAQEAFDYLTQLKQILQYLNVSDCNMEEGSLRAEANISVRPKGSTPFGTKTEVKNVASFSGTMKAIDFEIKRQIQVIRDGGTIVQETRGWDADRGITFSQRMKESAHDYRYFPEPDLMPVVLSDDEIESWRSAIPEMPAKRRERLTAEYGLPEYDAGVLVADKALADYYEEVARLSGHPKAASNWMMTEMRRLLTEKGVEIGQAMISPQALADLITMVHKKMINMTMAKEVFAILFEQGGDPEQIAKDKGWMQVSDADEIMGYVREAIAANPKSVADYRGGKKAALQFLVGQVMRASKGKANPSIVLAALQKELG